MVSPAASTIMMPYHQSSMRVNRRKAKKAYACCVNLALGTALVLVLFCNSIWAGLLSSSSSSKKNGSSSSHGTRITTTRTTTRSLSTSRSAPQRHLQEEGEEEHEEEEEEVEEEEQEEEGKIQWHYDPYGQGPDENAEYDPDSEDPIDRCRRDPTWRRTANYQDCQKLMNWQPRDTWWRLDTGHNDYVFEGHEQDIHDCIAHRFNMAKRQQSEQFPWTQCNENDRDESCRILPTRVTAHYKNYKEGEAVMFENAFTEQEAFALLAMQSCMLKYLPKALPWWEDRHFGGADRYAVIGGNEVTFVQGSIQLFTPGIAATLYRNFNMAYHEGNWRNAGFQNLGYPPPNTLGIRTAESLAYHQAGQLGTHTDSDSIFTIAIHLMEETSYDGGNFRLSSEHAFFKVPRLGAVSFFADSNHGVTKVTSGDRNIFVVELWENDDAPPGTPRPDFKAWDKHMQKRWPVVVGQAPEYLNAKEESTTWRS